MFDYLSLKSADAALGIEDPVEAASELNKQTTSTVRDIPARDARSVLLATGEYGALVITGRMAPSDSVPMQLIAAAITAVATLDTSIVIQSTDPVKWGAVQQMLGAFLQAGIISQASFDELISMREIKNPVWEPAVTDQDVIAAREITNGND